MTREKGIMKELRLMANGMMVNKMKIKKLQWSNRIDPKDDDCDYPHIKAVTPIGVFYIDWKDRSPSLECDEPEIYAIGLDCPMADASGQSVYSCETINGAKKLAQEIFEKMILECLEGNQNEN